MSKTTPQPTGWDNGLSQDYCRELHLWFASRIDARWVVRRMWPRPAATSIPAGRTLKGTP